MNQSTIASKFGAEIIGRLTYYLSGGLVTVFLARLLDPDAYGLLQLALAVFAIVEILSKAGLAGSAARYIAEYREIDPGQIPHIIKHVTKYSFVTIITVAIIFFFFPHQIASIIGEQSLTPFLQIGAVFLLASPTVANIRSILQGFDKIKISSIIYSIQGISLFILAGGLVFFGFGAIGALWGYIASYLLAAVLGLIVIYRIYIQYDPGTLEEGLSRRMLEYSLPIVSTQSANTIDNRVDTLLIGFFLSPVSVSYYVIGKQIVQFLDAPGAALGYTLAPELGRQKAAKEGERVSRMYETSLVYILSLHIPSAAGLILIAEPLIEYIFGTEYLGGVPVLQLLAIHTVLLSAMNITGGTLDYFGRARARAAAKMIASIINIVLNIILIPILGIIGAATATVVTYSLYSLINWYVIVLELDLRIQWIISKIILIFVSTAVMAIIVRHIRYYITGLITLFGVVGIGIVVYTIVALATGVLNIDEIKNNINY